MADVIDLKDFRNPDAMPAGMKPIFTTEIGAATVRYFIPASGDTPSLPWIPVEDIGLALGMDDASIAKLTWRIVQRWLPWLKTVDTPTGSKVIVPILGVVAILLQCNGTSIEAEIMNGAAEAMNLSFANATASERFQAMIIAARAASSPGEINTLRDVKVAEQTA